MTTLQRHKRAAGLTCALLTAPACVATALAQQHSHDKPATEKPVEQPVDHAAMGHGPKPPSAARPREPIPPLTDADRAAAFPDTGGGHAAHDLARHYFLQLDQLEAWDADPGSGVSWEALGWAGGDLRRLWLRSEGERADGVTEAAEAELFFGRAISRWWDLVGGIRHDFKPGGSQTFAGLGVIGLAPYKFEVEASAYFGESGQSTARIEVEYELLLTNRLILQPLIELDAYGEDDERRGIGAGLSTFEAGLRMRYEFTRRFAPYVGVVYERSIGDTADLRRIAGEDTSDTLVVAGLRTWF
jgi:copper resistance protein B